MDPGVALLAGLVTGLAIAVQLGVVSLLLVETAVVAGPRAGVAGGMGVATADFAFAAVAVAAGGAAGAALSAREAEIRVVAAVALAGIAAHGLVTLARTGAAGKQSTPRDAGAPARAPAASHYARFLAITSVNPLTIASFAAVAASLSIRGPAAAAAFVAGAGAASAAWHLLLPLAAGFAGRRLTPRVRHGLAIGGRLLVLAIAAHLALAA